MFVHHRVRVINAQRLVPSVFALAEPRLEPDAVEVEYLDFMTALFESAPGRFAATQC